MLPPLTDAVAVLGLSLVISTLCMRVLQAQLGAKPKVVWLVALCFALLWIPIGPAQLPVVAYVRGITSDLSLTGVLLACLGLWQRIFRLDAMDRREYLALYGVLASTAVVLYPLALGWGDWDPYRLGWGGFYLWAGLLVVALVSWLRGFMLLPVLIAFALFGWSAGLMETTNLWDYLIDPWLAVAAFVTSARYGFAACSNRYSREKRRVDTP